MSLNQDPTKIRSEAQQNASRENGKLSNGPVTDEGKAISSKNATKHGLYSSDVVLCDESQDRYDNLLDKYLAAFKPVGQPEYDLVVRMTNSAWRLRRVWALETALIDAEYAMIEENLAARFETIRPAQLAAEANLSISRGRSSGLDGIRRHEEHLDRHWYRALNGLIKLQTLRLGRKPVLEYTPESIEPDDYQNNFEIPEPFPFITPSSGKNKPSGRRANPRTPFAKDKPRPGSQPKAA